jgi:phosphatidylserine/phosphatidylglycerophosphate/cardiolipin synthase-like enzyme
MKNFLRYIALAFVSSFFFLTLVNAQSNPTPYDLSTGNYSFSNWPSTSGAGTYPPNMVFQRGPKQDPGLADEPNADYSDAYSLTSGPRMNGLGVDGFCWRNTGTNGNLGAAVLAVNTTGMSTVRVSWTGGTVAVDATTREYRIRLQYRVGTSGSFADVPGPIEYTVNSTAGHSQNFGPTLLPQAVNNQSVVQLRWKYYQIGGSNTRPQLRVGNIVVEANTGESSGDGTGSALVSPDTLKGPITSSIQIIYHRDTSFTVNGLRIIVPSAFVWSHNTDDVNFTNITADKTVSGDTLSFSNISFTADSTIITIANVASPDTTGVYTFKIQSKQNDYADIAPQQIVVFGNPLSIADMKANDANGVMINLNKLITVRGIVTVANQFNGPSYIQDNSGGMAIFGSSFSTAVNIGDEVVVSGLVQPFGGLSEIVNPVLHSIVSSGNIVEPQIVTANQVASDGAGGLELYEGMLVRVNGVTVTGSGNWAGNTNYALADATGSTEIRVPNGVTELVGTPIPAGAFDFIGVVGQYILTSPLIGGYQLMPRFKADLISSGPIIETLPVESNIQPTSFSISWTTVHDGTTRLRYGTTSAFELGVIENDNTLGTNHTVIVEGLAPATIYYIKAFSVAEPDTSFATTFVASTASSTSTGTMIVYFNQSVKTSLAHGENAQSLGSGIVNKLISRINAAAYSIDAAFYSLSGTVGANIANALIAAKNRGVKVRMIGEYDNHTTAPWTTLSNAGITVVFDNYDATNAGAGLMHNKFVVFDNRNAALSDTNDWVWSGSWNATDPGNNNDAQNVIEIQDRALANAYTMEFQEMWGSNTETPNAANSRFGARKLDNTPHQFFIGGTPVESYFSPSDRTTSQIIRTINKATVSVDIALLSFTRTDISSAMIAKKGEGIKVHALADVHDASWSVFDALSAGGIDVRVKGSDVAGFLHHKYGIIDAELNSATQYVITGSHNWSSNAENSNNENTLIIQSNRIANLYLQEFGARYENAGGTDVLLGVTDKGNELPTSFLLAQNYPNPFNPSTTIEFSVPQSKLVSIKIYDVVGREVSTLVNENLAAGSYKVTWNASKLSSGVYFYKMNAGNFVQTKKLLLQK